MIGELDRRITIYSHTDTQSATGEPIRSWSLIRTCWAFVELAGGSETIIGNTPTVRSDKTFTIRYSSVINENVRIEFEGQKYNIQHIEEIDRKRYMKISATIPDNE